MLSCANAGRHAQHAVLLTTHAVPSGCRHKNKTIENLITIAVGYIRQTFIKGQHVGWRTRTKMSGAMGKGLCATSGRRRK